MEGDFCQYASGFTLCHFNPLPPHGGRRSHSEIGRNHIKDFNPLPPHGGRLNDIVDSLLPLHFNPLPPHGGRLSRETFFSTCVPFQSTPSAWRETYDIDGNGDWITFQSTPSAWRETLTMATIYLHMIDFNPLPPHGGRLVARCCQCAAVSDFNPLPPHGGRHHRRGLQTLMRYFNPLPPHGGRHLSKHSSCGVSTFQSTPSAWRETGYIF